VVELKANLKNKRRRSQSVVVPHRMGHAQQQAATLCRPFTELVSQGGAQAGLQISGKRNGFGVAENFYAFASLVENQRAIFAMLEMTLQFLTVGEFELAIDVVRYLANDAFAIQFAPP
jgi:hypothetical protein